MLTKDGFALACGFSCYAKLSEYKTKSKDFGDVFTRIEEAIRLQKFEGASSGFFNHNIIARDLGLMNQEQMTVQMHEVIVPKVLRKEEQAD